jgi:formylglycine-generating enzyme required for sulfatase activity
MKNLFLAAVLLFSLTSYSQKKIKVNKDYKYIPSGEARTGEEIKSVDAFYICDHEVTNAEYMAFIKDIKLSNPSLYASCKPDTSLWVKTLNFTYNEPYATHYHWHTSYSNYPVVNITFEAAVAYCEWLTKKHNSTLKETKLTKSEYRLPSEVEWIRAARGNNHKWVYTWQTPYLRNAKGCFLANFCPIDNNSITRDSKTNEFKIIPDSKGFVLDGGFVTLPVKTYLSNAFDLFDICGNVAEMVTTNGVAKGGSWYDPGYDLRIDSPGNTHSIPSPMVGFRVVFVSNVD